MTTPLVLEPAPPGSRVEVHALPQDTAVVLAWRTVGGPALPLLLMVVWSPLVLVSLLITLQALGVPVFSMISGGAGRAAAMPLVQACMTAFTAVVFVIWLIPLDAWCWSRQELTISPRGVSYRRRSPLVSTLGWLFGETFRKWDATLDEIGTVRSNTDIDAVDIEVKGRTRRVLLHLAADGEVQWLAATVRLLVSVMRA